MRTYGHPLSAARAAAACLICGAVLAGTGCGTAGLRGARLPPDALAALRGREPRIVEGAIDADTALALALKHNPDLATLRADVDLASAERSVALRVDDPEMRLRFGNSTSAGDQFTVNAVTNYPLLFPPGAGYTNVTDHTTWQGDGSSFRAALRFYPPNPWAMSSRASAADARIMAAEATLQAEEWRIATEVRIALERLRYMAEDMKILRRLAAVQSELQDIAEAQELLGSGTTLDTLKASRSYLGAVIDLERAGQDYAEARMELSVLMGMSLPADLKLNTANAVPDMRDVADLDVAQLADVALRQRADMAAVMWRMKAAEGDVDEARASRIPWLSFVQLSYARTTRSTMGDTMPLTADIDEGIINSSDSSWDNMERDEWRIDAGITIPLFSAVTPVAAPAEAEKRRCETELESTWRAIVVSVDNALTHLSAAQAAVKDHALHSAPQVERMKKLAKDMEKRNDLPPEDILAVEDAILVTERNKCRLDHEYRVARIRLDGALGREITAGREADGEESPFTEPLVSD
jgi:outer membrane protein TolC